MLFWFGQYYGYLISLDKHLISGTILSVLCYHNSTGRIMSKERRYISSNLLTPFLIHFETKEKDVVNSVFVWYQSVDKMVCRSQRVR